MQDLKHLTQKKKPSLFSLFSRNGGNRKKQPSTQRPRLSMPTGKSREQLKYLLIFIALVLALTPVTILLIRKAPGFFISIANLTHKIMGSAKDTVKVQKPPLNRFAEASSLLKNANITGDTLKARTEQGAEIQYSINPKLQQKVHDFISNKDVPYAVFVAIEPATGRILAMTAHSSVDPAWESGAWFDLYPMASLFKMITASAALEQKKITPETVVEFRGNSYSENPKYWEIAPRGKNNRFDVTFAMGKSINPLYGRLACDIAGKGAVMACVQRFGFNQTLMPGIPVKTSQAAEPSSNHGLMLMGAGLDHEVKISPLHAANIMAAIANGGSMMMPSLVDKRLDGQGVENDRFAPQQLRRLIAPETASSLTKMLSSTVINGTSRRAFHDRRGRPLVKVSVAAKTGSINGTNPKGYYSWFAAFAPIEKPQIALVTLVINQDLWKIKSAQVGALALETFFQDSQ